MDPVTPTPTPTSARQTLRALVCPPSRADARRNYDALLAAAGEVFGAAGPDASLDEIARRAGVGNATLYRHFPTRRDLVVAVCVDDVEMLCELGERLRSSGQPGQALARWLSAYVEHVSSRQGLGAAMMTGRPEDSALVTACREAIAGVGVDLLEPAQRAGEVRGDVELADLLRLASAVATATESDHMDGKDSAARLLEIVLHGIVRR
ncbi:MAG TPA: helix-turn-helix domain-containing protein [Pseudonocardia sp.]|nr:helix-turn-helix domain-containing protein [Pseudonocardia sp.]